MRSSTVVRSEVVSSTAKARSEQRGASTGPRPAERPSHTLSAVGHI